MLQWLSVSISILYNLVIHYFSNLLLSCEYVCGILWINNLLLSEGVRFYNDVAGPQSCKCCRVLTGYISAFLKPVWWTWSIGESSIRRYTHTVTEFERFYCGESGDEESERADGWHPEAACHFWAEDQWPFSCDVRFLQTMNLGWASMWQLLIGYLASTMHMRDIGMGNLIPVGVNSIPL